MIEIYEFGTNHIEAAHRMALDRYNAERAAAPGLPAVGSVPDLSWFAEHGKGVAAVENGKFTGFLCAFGPIDNPFGNRDCKGFWSPVHSNASAGANRVRVYREMYRAIAEKWVSQGALSHALTLYAHDQEAVNAFFTYGFGLRCVDMVKPLEKREIEPCEGLSFAELPRSDAGRIRELNDAMVDHLSKSPCFLHNPKSSAESLVNEAEKNDSRFFIAKRREEILAFLKVAPKGETFASLAPDMQNICGAYLLPEYRGRGIFDALLYFAENTLAKEGYACLGVDFESYNPAASGFWSKHFTAYTYSLVRRVDDNALWEK